MPKSSQPRRLTLRAYKVGFGDCFLLTFHYPSDDRHVLIDFGSTGSEDGDDLMVRVAQDIHQQCGGKIHAVVATHRHKDHINGFATRKSQDGPGDIIASCQPDVVIQPWTEDPRADPKATGPTAVSAGKKGLGAAQAFVGSLNRMHGVAEAALSEIDRLRSLGPGLTQNAFRQLSFLGEDNISNRSAVENLMKMGKHNFYVHFGSKSGLESVLPGVKTRVLGPPTIEQSATIKTQRARDEAEFWHFQAVAGELAAAGGDALFAGVPTCSHQDAPPHTRWFIERARALRGEQLLEIVRSLDKAMNNTSVILLLEAAGKKLLFPGDAQIENWSFALGKPDVQELLKGVTLYKVGHHGSLNATPKSLWELFQNKNKKPSAARLRTIVSTMAGKHGDPRRGTEVPRQKLVEALEAESDYFSTQDIKGRNKIREDFTMEL